MLQGLQSWQIGSFSFWNPVSSPQWQWAPSPLREPPKGAHHSPYPLMPVFLKKDEPMLQVVSIPVVSTEAIAGLFGSSMLMLPMGLPGGPPVPCHIASLSLPDGAFKWVNLKDSGKDYMCRECNNMPFIWDTLVSHSLKVHLTVHLAFLHVQDELQKILKCLPPWKQAL